MILFRHFERDCNSPILFDSLILFRAQSARAMCIARIGIVSPLPFATSAGDNGIERTIIYDVEIRVRHGLPPTRRAALLNQ